MNRHQRRHGGFAAHIDVAPPNTDITMHYGSFQDQGKIAIQFSRPVSTIDLTPEQANAMIDRIHECLKGLADSLGAKTNG